LELCLGFHRFQACQVLEAPAQEDFLLLVGSAGSAGSAPASQVLPEGFRRFLDSVVLVDWEDSVGSPHQQEDLADLADSPHQELDLGRLAVYRCQDWVDLLDCPKVEACLACLDCQGCPICLALVELCRAWGQLCRSWVAWTHRC
jgi:hypothetical protein